MGSIAFRTAMDYIPLGHSGMKVSRYIPGALTFSGTNGFGQVPPAYEKDDEIQRPEDSDDRQRDHDRRVLYEHIAAEVIEPESHHGYDHTHERENRYDFVPPRGLLAIPAQALSLPVNRRGPQLSFWPIIETAEDDEVALQLTCPPDGGHERPADQGQARQSSRRQKCRDD
ncbi:hypothetical protein [Microbacterium sp. LWH13-1.2]|uniref:hypothetical protein n=1 Tax=Microbacterium sp. LWH13-1.2 TaxID=3135260 RepID=UPI003139AC16